ncbi:MAG: alpha/beta fold hydrolase [Gammaproteobacteria bacterium]|nr:alpha/beta fold hydrolase [Gammaproteobacteria bacterium]
MGSPASERPQSRSFRSFDGTRLVYYVHADDNDGDAVILLHGLLSSARALHDLGNSLAARGIRPFSLDLRAHGRSEAPRDPAAYRDQAMARDVIALCEHLGLTEYAIFAYGVGSELTSRVINLGAPVTRAVMCGWGGPPSDLLDQYASEEWARQAERLAQGFETDEPDTIADRKSRAWRDAADRGGVDRLALAARLRSGDSAEPGLDPRGIDIPVLAICGADDASPNAFAEALPNATAVVVGGGHTTAGRDPALAAAAIDFLANDSAPPAGTEPP